MLVMSSTAFAAGQANDINGHWAKKEINNLLAKGIMSTYGNGTFKPNQPITRAEFATSLAKTLNLTPISVTNLKDIQTHPAKGYVAALVRKEIITGYPDNTFRPEKAISRSELVTMLVRALELNKMETKIELDKSIYRDVSTKHWANNSINLTTKLGIITGYPNNTFRPDNLVTRAETAKMLSRFLKLEVIQGNLIEKYPLANKIRVKKNDGSELTLDLASDPLIGRNKRITNLRSLLRNDNLHLVLNQANEVKYLKAYGVISEDDLAFEVSEMTGGLFNTQEVKSLAKGNYQFLDSKLNTEVSKRTNGLFAPSEVESIASGNINVIESELNNQLSQMTKGVLSPSEVKALSQGNLKTLEPTLRQGIESRLVKQGLTTNEAQALLDQDWNTLQSTGKNRLVEAVSLQTGLPVDVTKAIFEQNWTRLQRLAEIELIQRATVQVMNSGLLS